MVRQFKKKTKKQTKKKKSFESKDAQYLNRNRPVNSKNNAGRSHANRKKKKEKEKKEIYLQKEITQI